MDITGIYLRGLQRCKQFTRKEERQLWERMRDGQEARRLLVESMLAFVASRLRKYRSTAADHGVDYDDLVQQVAVSLLRVVDQVFDPGKGRLTTIMDCHLRQTVQRMLCTCQLVHVPAYQSGKTRNDKYATDVERANHAVVSLAGKIYDDIRAGNGSHPATPMMAREDAQQLRLRVDKLLWELDRSRDLCQRDREIFRGYYLDKRSHKELGKHYGISGARVGQILEQVRHVLRRRLKEAG